MVIFCDGRKCIVVDFFYDFIPGIVMIKIAFLKSSSRDYGSAQFCILEVG